MAKAEFDENKMKYLAELNLMKQPDKKEKEKIFKELVEIQKREGEKQTQDREKKVIELQAKLDNMDDVEMEL